MRDPRDTYRDVVFFQIKPLLMLLPGAVPSTGGAFTVEAIARAPSSTASPLRLGSPSCAGSWRSPCSCRARARSSSPPLSRSMRRPAGSSARDAREVSSRWGRKCCSPRDRSREALHGHGLYAPVVCCRCGCRGPERATTAPDELPAGGPFPLVTRWNALTQAPSVSAPRWPKRPAGRNTRTAMNSTK